MSKTLHGEEGFTLVEMMVTMVIMIVVLFALYSIFDTSVRVFSFGNDEVEAVENARLGLEKTSREIRVAHPYDKGAATTDTHLFDAMTASRITFANDLGTGDRIVDQATEEITYEARSTANLANTCSTATMAPCTLYRTVGAGAAQPVVENLAYDDGGTPGTVDDVPGIRFEYLKKSGTGLVAAAGDAEVEVVRITLLIEKGEGGQRITTDVDMRNRG